MKVLLDSCVWGPTQTHLRSLRHDVAWTGDWDRDPGDQEILSHAHREGRILITLDKDFGELAIVHGQAHSGILRLVGVSARQQGAACAAILEKYGPLLAQGALITATLDRVRIRPPRSSGS